MSLPSQFFLQQPCNPLPINFFIGTQQLDKLKLFCDETGLRILEDNGTPVARLAPSVVTRGEVQLFNVDAPRFSIRVYLADNRGFINLRRMAEVINRLKGEDWIISDHPTTIAYRTTRESAPYYKPDSSIPTPQSVFQEYDRRGKRNVIADCLLTPPPKLVETHNFVTADLGWVYGEGESWDGVPFVCAMTGFSGGACAQACAFMISALLHQYPPDPSQQAGIHGLAEITAMTTPAGFDLMMRGLRIEMLAEYFARAGRNVFKYIHHELETAVALIAAHIRSNFAPILLVAKRVKGVLPDAYNHVVVAVGASKTQTPDLIINDPSRYPFAVWNRAEYIRKCGPFQFPATLCVLPSRVKCPLAAASIVSMENDLPQERQLEHGVWEMAAFMSRHRARAKRTQSIRPPPIENFSLIQMLLDRTASGDLNSVPTVLATAGHAKRGSIGRFWRGSQRLQAFAGRWVWLQKVHDTNGRLCQVVLWDAERLPSFSRLSYDMCSAFVLCTINRSWNTWRIDDFATERADDGPKPSTSFKLPKRHPGDQSAGDDLEGHASAVANEALPITSSVAPAVITSFSATGLKLAFDQTIWPQRLIQQTEVYAFMHCDLSLFAEAAPDENAPGSFPSVVERLSHIFTKTPPTNAPRGNSSNTPSEPDSPLSAEIDDRSWKERRYDEQERLARKLDLDASAAGATIRAFATHMPQLYSENPRRALQARRALCVLAQLRDRLQGKHDVRVIEMSAGSRVRGLIPRMSEAQRDNMRSVPNGGEQAPDLLENLTLFASRRPDDVSIDVLISRLQDLVREMRKAVGREALGFALALEVEPGPLFVLNSASAVHEVASRISAAPDIAEVVGFNVDIAHCILAGITPDEIFDSDVVESRICHFHISDHGIGHFGDAPLGDCGFGRWALTKAERLAAFRDWIDRALSFARTVTAEHHQVRPPFSGIISVELEAAKYPSQVTDSLRTLRSLLRDAESTTVHSEALEDFKHKIRRQRSTVVKRSAASLKSWWEWLRTGGGS